MARVGADPDALIRSADQGSRALLAIRSMTVGIFATAAIATAFLEGQVLPINLLSLIGLVCFLGIAAMSILVLTNRVRVPLGSDDAGPPSDDEAAREALTHIRTAVDRATLYLQISILLLAAEIIVSAINASRV